MPGHVRWVLAAVVAAVALTVAAPAAGDEPDGAGASASPLPSTAVEVEPAPDDTGLCEELHGPARAACSAVGAGLSWGVEHVVVGGAQTALRQLVDFVVDGAVWLLGEVVAFIDTSTRPDVTADWFRTSYRDMALVGLMGLLPFLMLAVIQGLVRQSGAMLMRAAFVYVPVAAIGTAGAIVVVDMLVQLTDHLSHWVARSFGSDLTGFARSVSEALRSLSSPVGGAVAGLAGLLAAALVAFAAFVIWLELLLRQAAIYVAVLFLPLGFMALVWPATAHWLRRLIQGLVAVILSKFVIVAVMALAASALGAGTTTGPGDGGFGVVVSGAAMLSLAALAPYVLLRIIPVFEAGLAGDLEGTYRRPTAAVGTPHVGGRMSGLVRRRTGGAAVAGVPAGAIVAAGGPSGEGGRVTADVGGRADSQAPGGRGGATRTSAAPSGTGTERPAQPASRDGGADAAPPPSRRVPPRDRRLPPDVPPPTRAPEPSEGGDGG